MLNRQWNALSVRRGEGDKNMPSNVRRSSIMTPRLRTVSDARKMPLGRGRSLSASLILASCCLVPSQITSDFSVQIITQWPWKTTLVFLGSCDQTRCSVLNLLQLVCDLLLRRRQDRVAIQGRVYTFECVCLLKSIYSLQLRRHRLWR